ncbi:MAG: DUF814 domain-containing protein [Nanoarchaeota archaeon]|nr:DUF814 domain-containing protein [Nanoarchaeota archaeon]
MKIELDAAKSVEENAAHYFEMAKTARRKLEGAKAALEVTKKKLANLEHDMEKKKQEIIAKAVPKRKREWFERFRWLYSSEGFLIVAGRDATTNEVVVKKHCDAGDLVFHCELPGSPFAVIKSQGKEIGKKTIEETAQFVACFSKGWKAGRSLVDVYYVKPEQVTKEAPAGEYISKGSFMIYGRKTSLTVPLKLFIGKMEDGRVMAGPKEAILANCKASLELSQGDMKPSEAAKKIRVALATDDIDEIIKTIPVGTKA